MCDRNSPFLKAVDKCDIYDNCNFTFEDEVKITHKIYDKKKIIVMYSESNSFFKTK